ncbi:MAG: cation:dicarboxylase symporter family transporter [Candidatus Solibacter usitatus]|nr:cation:dicarboxylase symporter family transporter [Candidatus Solibacter usitatus]
MKKLSLTSWIFIAMAAGIAVGHFFPDVGKQLSPASNIFIRMIKSIIAPLLFATLVVGIAGSGSAKAMGRIGLKSIIYFEIVTTVALFLGLGAVNLVKPGAGLSLEQAVVDPSLPQTKTSLASVLEHTFPNSIIDAMAKGEVLQMVVFCFLFGTACTMIGAKAEPVVKFLQSVADVMFEYTKYVMYLAPFGVGAAMAAVVGSKGITVLFGLGKLILTLYGALVVFVVGVLGLVMVIFKIPMRRFVHWVKEPYVLAFSTASSEAALPLALENMEKFGVPKHIVAFVLPTGYSFNLDGSTLYLSLASVFVAQAAGVDLTLSQQLLMMLTLMLTSKGVAAVPRASLIILAGTLSAFKLPVEGIALLLGVDTLMDMARTSVNLLGNCLASAVIARWEGYDLNAPEAHES